MGGGVFVFHQKMVSGTFPVVSFSPFLGRAVGDAGPGSGCGAVAAARTSARWGSRRPERALRRPEISALVGLSRFRRASWLPVPGPCAPSPASRPGAVGAGARKGAPGKSIKGESCRPVAGILRLNLSAQEAGENGSRMGWGRTGRLHGSRNVELCVRSQMVTSN